jgi:hypothetical protein
MWSATARTPTGVPRCWLRAGSLGLPAITIVRPSKRRPLDVLECSPGGDTMGSPADSLQTRRQRNRSSETPADGPHLMARFVRRLRKKLAQGHPWPGLGRSFDRALHAQPMPWAKLWRRTWRVAQTASVVKDLLRLPPSRADIGSRTAPATPRASGTRICRPPLDGMVQAPCSRSGSDAPDRSGRAPRDLACLATRTSRAAFALLQVRGGETKTKFNTAHVNAMVSSSCRCSAAVGGEPELEGRDR